MVRVESREDVSTILSMEGSIDLIIPRGSNAFVRYVMDNTKIPVIGHSDGKCSIYIDESANLSLALDVILDAKTNYPAACNAVETILVHKNIYKSFKDLFLPTAESSNIVVHESNYNEMTEYLGLELTLRKVENIEEAINLINSYGSHHTDAIIATNKNAIEDFFNLIDSADVFANCSTRFADGFRFGLGAEVGISTSRIHARGPVGLDGLMTTKWLLTGNGHVVSSYMGPKAKSFIHKNLPKE
ncbi:MAG: aldehyde dehydrogenase family protein [Sphaerochaetaceae bacterium]|nr:aldehyde dehydrogenase family protein [Sphaerochaetaceae bacterium]